MVVLSLFDGISCARVALDRLGYNDLLYFASEIDKYAIQIALKNYPDTIQLGSVTDIDLSVLPEQIDLLIGGSPCQDLSIAKAGRKGLDGERSGLFWEYVRIWKAVKPKYFVLENVNSMPKDAKRVITETMGVEPIMINATLVSAQNRKRLFWTNICNDILGNQNMPLPEDRGILLKDILESGKFEPENRRWRKWARSASGMKRIKAKHIAINPEKSLTLMARMYANWSGNFVDQGNGIRKLTPVECERLQSLPDNYTEGISNTQRYKCLGNGFNVEVVRHILSFMEID